jgi:hypothetical protein
MDGLQSSTHFKLVDTPPINDVSNYTIQQEHLSVVWIVDVRRYHIPGNGRNNKSKNGENSTTANQQEPLRDTWKQLLDLTENTIRYHQRQYNSTLDIKIVLMDWRDRLNSDSIFRNDHIQSLIKVVGPQNVRLMARQIVVNRKWNPTQNFVGQGVIAPSMIWQSSPSPILHIPYKLRSDYANEVLKRAAEHQRRDDMGGGSIAEILINIPRSIDVAHFWPVRIEKEPYGKLRNYVTSTILELVEAANQTFGNKSSPIHVLCDYVSKAGGIGRTSTQDAYISALMNTKIVVVAQRDEWEDHYRFFEGIVGGALVLTDPMLTLPKGYQHKKNIIVYNNLEELKRYILYYVQHEEERKKIALQGWKLAMNRHRTFHAMEELFFGKALTNTSIYY